MTDAFQASPSADAAPHPIELLFDGIKTFQKEVFPARRAEFAELAKRQDPDILFIACADSRVVPEMITQTQPGDLFVCRNIGNIVPSYGEMLGGVSAVIEYAVMALGVSEIVICGHSDCGAMKGLLNPAVLDAMPTVASWLRNAQAARSVVEIMRPDLEGEGKIQALVEQNVRTQLQHLLTHPSVAAGVASGSLRLHGWVYDIETGGIRRFHEATGTMVPVGAEGSPAGVPTGRGAAVDTSPSEEKAPPDRSARSVGTP